MKNFSSRKCLFELRFDIHSENVSFQLNLYFFHGKEIEVSRLTLNFYIRIEHVNFDTVVVSS